MIKAENIKRSFGERAVLDGASISIDCTMAALMGESGSGKTTFLRILSGLEKADSGDAEITGKTAVVFAEPRLFPGVSAMENVTCVMSGEESFKAERAMELFRALGIEHAAHFRPRELSSGMASRVSIARAIAYSADNYLFDEPFRALDEESRKNVISYIKKCLVGKSVLIITHNASDADMLCDEKYQLFDGKINEIC